VPNRFELVLHAATRAPALNRGETSRVSTKSVRCGPGTATATKTPPAGSAKPPQPAADNRGEFRVVIKYPR
jgi:DNA-directed RNA polymerase subunit K/omega